MNIRCITFPIIFLFLVPYLQAASLDGTSSLKYQSTPYVLRDTDTVTGYVRFASGFTILPATNHASSATLDTCISCSGGFDLQGTSTLKLTGDLTLDSATTLTSGGKIYGYNRTLILGGNLTLNANQVLHLGGNLIIDGCGHDIFLNEYAQLMLDNYATVTIKNAIIHNKCNPAGWSTLAITTTMSQLTLSDIELALDSDFNINSGRLFIHNDVAVTGTSALAWRSIGPCTIEPNSNLYFDVGTTFSYAPPTTNKDLIRMTDQSSVLHLNGCSLLATHTGLRLTKGTVIFDNRISLNSRADDIINATTSAVLTNSAYTRTGSGPHNCAFSHNTKYIAVVNSTNNTLQTYLVSGGMVTQIGNTISTGTHPVSVAFSPDGKYIAVANDGSNTLQICSFSGTALTQVGSNATTANNPWTCTWSPDGKYIAVVTYSGQTLQIFAFTGGTPVQIGASVSTGANTGDCSWSPDGKYVAVTTEASTLKIFSFSGGTPVQVGSNATTGSKPWGCEWSPDGKYIAVSNWQDGTLQVFSFTGTTPSQVGENVSTGASPPKSHWSADGRYIVTLAAGIFKTFVFLGGTPTLTGGSISTGGSPYNSAWSPDGKYIAIANYGSNLIQVFTVNHSVDSSAQAVTNGIIFGNSTAGATQDVTVKVLTGSQVGVNGILNVDNA